MAETTKEIRTYFSVSHPIDPARVVTLADMDMAYALATTLIDWDESRQPRSALAQRWEFQPGHIVRFHLSPSARWSDGNPITANDVKASFERAKKTHGKDLKSLFDMVDQIRSPDQWTIEFHLVGDHLGLMLLNKLTEPMFGVLKIKPDGTPDLNISSGAFILESTSSSETVLKKNSYWPYATHATPDRIVLRSSNIPGNPEKMIFDDKWPNLIVSQSLMKDTTLAKIKKSGLSVWERNIDRVMMLTFLNGRLANPTGFQLFRFLQKQLNRTQLQSGLGGLHPTDQVFAPGYPLHLANLSCSEADSTFPESLKGKHLRVLIVPERVPAELRENFSKALQEATGTAPEFHEVPLNRLAAEKMKREHDFYLGSYGVGDPNYEGALSYFFELNPPPIASGQGSENFAARTAALRTLGDESKRIMASREILRDAICAGALVPLFHFSTAVITGPDLDLSKVPATDETVSFPKIRFKDPR